MVINKFEIEPNLAFGGQPAFLSHSLTQKRIFSSCESLIRMMQKCFLMLFDPANAHWSKYTSFNSLSKINEHKKLNN